MLQPFNLFVCVYTFSDWAQALLVCKLFVICNLVHFFSLLQYFVVILVYYKQDLHDRLDINYHLSTRMEDSLYIALNLQQVIFPGLKDHSLLI